MSHQKPKGKRRAAREISEFRQCTICKCVVNSQFAVEHSEVCSETRGKWFTSTSDCDTSECLTFLNISDKPVHSFIKYDRYYGSVVVRNDKMTESLKYLPEVYKQRLVMVNTLVAKQCKLMRGDYIVLSDNRGEQMVLSLWPSDAVKIENIGLAHELITSFGLRQGEWIEIKLFNSNKIPAKDIVLKSTVKCVEDLKSIFSSQIYYHQDGQFYTEGNKLLLRDADGHYEFEIKKLTGQENEVNSMSTLERSLFGRSVLGNDESVLSNSEQFLNVTPMKLSTSCRDTTAGSINLSQEEISSSVCDSMLTQFCTPKTASGERHDSDESLRKRDFYYIDQSTKIAFENETPADLPKRRFHVSNVKLGGFTKELVLMKKLCEYKLLSQCEGFELLNWTGLLIHGVSGIGKTLLVQKLAAEINWNLIYVKSWEIFNKRYGESERLLRTIFSDASKSAPSIIFFDKIDLLCSKWNNAITDLEARVASTLKSEMENMQAANVVVIGTVNEIERIDLNFRRPGIFDKEIRLDVPTKTDRFEILKVLLEDLTPVLPDDDIIQLADVTPGFVGSDLEALCAKAKLHALALKRVQDLNDSNLKPMLKLTLHDFNFVLKLVRPNTIRDCALRIPKVTWADIAINPEVKEQLEQSVIWPLKNPNLLKINNLNASHGVLLYGPPGCSKTLIASALANESGFNFLAIKGPELYDKYVGETEKAVRSVFERARKSAPTILFIDEFDSLVSGRGSGSQMEICQVENRVRSILLTEINGINILDGVAIIAATNRPECIDEALLRAGRLGTKIYIPLPDENIRRQIFQIQFRSKPIGDDVDLDELVSRTHNYSGAQVVQVCHCAAQLAMVSHMPKLGNIDMEYFTKAIELNRPNMSEELIRTNEEFYNKSVR